MSTLPETWLDRLITSPAVQQLGVWLESEQRVVVEGSVGSSTTLLAGALATNLDRPILLVVAHLDDADDALEDLRLFATRDHKMDCRRFGALEVMPGESNVSLELLAERLAIVERIVRQHRSQRVQPGLPEAGDPADPSGAGVLVAPIQALMQGVPEPSALETYQLSIEAGKELAPGQLFEWLDRAGYARTDAIEEPGDFATRGGIVDIYLPSSGRDDGSVNISEPTPIRLDYFGDEIESICVIETDTMGSGNRLDRVQLIGASIERLQSDDRTTTLLRLLPDDTIIVLHEVLELAEQARGYYERLTDARGIYSPEAVLKMLTQRQHVQVHQYTRASQRDVLVKLSVHPLASFDQTASNAVRELGQLATDNTQAIALCQNEAEEQRLRELIEEHTPEKQSLITTEVAYLHRGFFWDEPDHFVGHLVPHHELFHRYNTRRRIRKISISTDRATDAFLDLEPGDYVVHVEHGIAKFNGLRAMRRKNRTEDFLTLEFAKRVLLHVPATQIDLVQRYVGGFHGKPPLSTLGGKRWAKQKQQVAEAVKDLAAELLRVQAARASLPGVRYPADTTWQQEFEAEFPYEETDDQIATIAEVKKDMADEQPMDRLICGDVGFGKTEIAIRAAFKAVEYGKQVAVLVPTTVLAEQHERTFRGRMADYPFRIETVSRFKTAKQQKQVLDALRLGQVDVLIGTHRVLSKDVKFADLGLVIIDEEQRFGVKHKQKLLEFRLTADVLTLTATPIPRTLHMSMLGLRNISSLSTPPMDRRAIVTEVVPFDTHRVKTAIMRELNRDGQIFFVHNRVYDIQTIADEVQKLVPDARVVVGHGQMPSHELEKVMLSFLRRAADILVCTTIIESGIDIPTANTIFIDGSDHFGLADLHQLRGRVGRYKHRAYCYLLLPMDRPITDKAQRRLKAIEQYSMLGAGFKIAMRDLEIRGAGNLLGSEQSGHIAAVGYEMYCKMLEQEAAKLREEPVHEPAKTHLELPMHGRIPPKYISSEKHRMDAYRRLSRAVTLEELENVVADLTAAYGPAPEPMQTLMNLTELRIAASTLGIKTIKLDGPDLIFRTTQPQKLDTFMKDAAGRTSLIDDRTVYYRPSPSHLEPPTLLAVLRKLLVNPLLAGASATANGDRKGVATAGAARE